MSVEASVKYRPATEADIPGILRLVVPDPASPLTAAGFRARLASGEYRPEWTWLADSGSGDDGIEAAAIWWGDTGPNGLDAIVSRPDLSRDRRAEVAGELLTAAHLAYNRSRTLPAYHVHLPVDWQARPDVVAALSWRWQAAVASGLTDELERLRFEWTAGTPLAEPGGPLTFRREPDDQVFARLFSRALDGTLDATSRRMADVVGEYSQARSDVDFYRDRLPGDRGWWFTAHAPDGKTVGFGVPNRNNEVAVVGYLGVLPEFRGHGYIHDILAEVTRILAVEAGAGVIHADTDVANRPMAAAFERGGYRNTARRVVLSAPLILG
ncbi:MAG: GNAT family N-acetyltransferase [Streptosporangiales bacterium]|jgi:RimJ/RimL family protein N-acetyltransferase|nr:GNAT family N-acetyltransferase [Streptosporangiales bacterium]